MISDEDLEKQYEAAVAAAVREDKIQYVIRHHEKLAEETVSKALADLPPSLAARYKWLATDHARNRRLSFRAWLARQIAP